MIVIARSGPTKQSRCCGRNGTSVRFVLLGHAYIPTTAGGAASWWRRPPCNPPPHPSPLRRRGWRGKTLIFPPPPEPSPASGRGKGGGLSPEERRGHLLPGSARDVCMPQPASGAQGKRLKSLGSRFRGNDEIRFFSVQMTRSFAGMTKGENRKAYVRFIPSGILFFQARGKAWITGSSPVKTNIEWIGTVDRRGVGFSLRPGSPGQAR